MVLSNVMDIVVRDYAYVDPSESLDHVVRIMDKRKTDRVLVVKKGKLVGILAKWDIMLKLGLQRSLPVTSGKIHASGVMNSDLVTADPSATLNDVVDLMVKHDIGSVIIVEDETIHGIVTRHELINALKDLLGKIRVGDAMLTLPIILKPRDKIVNARNTMIEYRTSYLPIHDPDSDTLGYITVDEVSRALLDLHTMFEYRHRGRRLETMIIADYMRFKPIITNPDTRLDKLYEEMSNKRARGAIVVSGDRVVGIVTLREIIKSMWNFMVK